MTWLGGVVFVQLQRLPWLAIAHCAVKFSATMCSASKTDVEHSSINRLPICSNQIVLTFGYNECTFASDTISLYLVELYQNSLMTLA